MNKVENYADVGSERDKGELESEPESQVEKELITNFVISLTFSK